MEKKNIVCLALIMFLSTACSNDEISESAIPVRTYPEDSTTVDIDNAIDNAIEEVNRMPSGAQLGFFSFTGQYQTLSEFEGEMFLSFVTNYLSSKNRCDGFVVPNKGSSDGSWGVRCGSPEEVFIHCIEIEPISGQVRDLGR